jgi:hypothetical protein
MQRPLHTGRLVLTPENPYQQPVDPTAVLVSLQKIAFVGEPFSAEANCYFLGRNFMHLISFVGCAPYVRLQPDKPGQPFCHLRVDGPYERPRLLYGRNTTPPRCATCRKRLPEWQKICEKWQQDGAQASCPHCGRLQDPATYDFRQSAGCGRLFLFIENIFPQEAIPTAALLAHLWETSGQAWLYFYIQDSR